MIKFQNLVSTLERAPSHEAEAMTPIGDFRRAEIERNTPKIPPTGQEIQALFQDRGCGAIYSLNPSQPAQASWLDMREHSNFVMRGADNTDFQNMLSNKTLDRGVDRLKLHEHCSPRTNGHMELLSTTVSPSEAEHYAQLHANGAVYIADVRALRNNTGGEGLAASTSSSSEVVVTNLLQEEFVGRFPVQTYQIEVSSGFDEDFNPVAVPTKGLEQRDTDFIAQHSEGPTKLVYLNNQSEVQVPAVFLTEDWQKKLQHQPSQPTSNYEPYNWNVRISEMGEFIPNPNYISQK